MLKPKAKLLFCIYLALAISYIVLSFAVPPSSSNQATKYQLSAGQSQVLQLTIALPLAIIWFIGFYGYDRLRTYADSIRDNKDGTAMDMLAKGLLWLGLYLPVTSMTSLLASYVRSYRQDLYPASVMLSNYIVLAVLLLGFVTLLKGSTMLAQTVKQRPYRLREQLLILMFFIISAVYIYITLTNPARQFPTTQDGRAAFYMSDMPLFITIIIPSLYVWYAGIRSAYNIHLYCKRVAGILYRQALNSLAYGIALAACGVMAIRYLSSASNFLTTSATLKVILGIIYLLLIVVGVSFGLIAVGTRRLQKIEEV